MDQQQRDTIGAVLGRTPSGLFILTARSAAGQETGMLASWVQQASFDPPAVTVAVNKQRFLHEWLAQSPRMVLNLVGETQRQFLGHFARGFEPDEPAFEGVQVKRTESGLPALADALGWLEGTIDGTVDAGDHLVYVVRVTSARRGAQFDGERPWVHVRKSGFGY